MGTVVAFEPFRLEQEELARVCAPPERPHLSGSEIWGRDYTRLESVVYGLLTVRDIAAWCAGCRHPELDSLCLDALQASHGLEETGLAHLKRSIAPLKEWLMDLAEQATDPARRDLSWGVVLLDLIEKSPRR